MTRSRGGFPDLGVQLGNFQWHMIDSIIDAPICATEFEESERRCPPCFTNLAQKYLIWECSPTWLKFKKILFEIVTDPFTELTITFCIVVNTVFMAMEHHGMSRAFDTMLQIGNYVSALAQQGV